ncbi:hypothetical protein [Cohnella sp. GbtcB17]|uniref:hypothetical protein n=1 Tax=Cohnella sp. GbtcB17 TaxID=2824762 RepID=UPI001C2FF81D|nr:hypothetical protein [Cohnella sp. GbtcB17]
MTAKKQTVQVLPRHAVNLGTGKQPDLKRAGDTFSCSPTVAAALEEAGSIQIVKEDEENA